MRGAWQQSQYWAALTQPPMVPCRAPAVVIGYLMKLRNWRLAEAYKWVKDKRPSINISQSAHGVVRYLIGIKVLLREQPQDLIEAILQQLVGPPAHTRARRVPHP